MSELYDKVTKFDVYNVRLKRQTAYLLFLSNEETDETILPLPKTSEEEELYKLCLNSAEARRRGASGGDLIALIDGTPSRYHAVMQQWFAQRKADQCSPAELTALVNEWYEATRKPWDGYVDFSNPSVSSASTGTKGGDNADLTCTPSTNSTAGQDDYAGLPLFAPVDCNWEIDEITLEPVITAIAGITKNFTRTDPTKMVGVLQASGYVYVVETTTTYRIGYTSTFIPYANIAPLPEAVRPSDNSIRPWVVHAKYLNHTVDGKLTSYSGPIPTSYSISHNALHTLAAATGTGYSGECYCDWNFLHLMFWIKYASLSADGILQGCLANNLTATAAVSEEGVKRILIAAEGAPAFEAGMGALVGEKNSGGNIERGSASCYNISTNAGCKITAVEDVTIDEVEYKAIYLDLAESFDSTEGSTCVASFLWPNGSCDSVLGNDGSPGSPTGGKYPAKLQGIEYSVGASEVFADAMADFYKDGDDYFMRVQAVNRAAKQASSVTNDYSPVCAEMAQPGSAAYLYIKHMAMDKGMFVPDTFGGSSSTYHKDAWYLNASTVALHEIVVFGTLLNVTGYYGLSYAYCYYALTYANWHIVSRPSPNGNRGEWQA